MQSNQKQNPKNIEPILVLDKDEKTRHLMSLPSVAGQQIEVAKFDEIVYQESR